MNDKEYISLGRITKPQGLKGAFRLRAFSIESENIISISNLYIKDQSGNINQYTIRKVTPRKGFFVVELKELDHINQVETMKGWEVFADPDQVAQLDEGDYYWYELIGLQVRTTTGENLGKVTSIIPTGANDVLQVQNGRKEVLIPYIEGVIVEINLESEEILVDPPEGLLD